MMARQAHSRPERKRPRRCLVPSHIKERGFERTWLSWHPRERWTPTLRCSNASHPKCRDGRWVYLSWMRRPILPHLCLVHAVLSCCYFVIFLCSLIYNFINFKEDIWHVIEPAKGVWCPFVSRSRKNAASGWLSLIGVSGLSSFAVLWHGWLIGRAYGLQKTCATDSKGGKRGPWQKWIILSGKWLL